ncbi:hypothetical protein, partial [Pseudanabaena sp. UWO310]|uniref:hypothetical protein n=1 Tax=Pseudanabaena sp. UWO310 TaxID=2480795 RepID=UPI001CC1C69D
YQTSVMVQFIELIAFVFTYGLNHRNKCETASIHCFCFPTSLLSILCTSGFGVEATPIFQNGDYVCAPNSKQVR